MPDRIKKYFFLNILTILFIFYIFIFCYQPKKNPPLKFGPNYPSHLNKTTHISPQSFNSTISSAATSKNVNPNLIFDLSKPLEPNATYAHIQCVKSASVHVSTSLCLHKLNMDVHVSGSIWRDGLWEPHLLRPFMDMVKNNPHWLVVDIGAHIGQYSLFSAKLGRKVVCVEPFLDNVLRIHKAVYLEKLWEKITLINGAVSNRRHEVKRLSPSFGNIGGQSLIYNKNEVFDQSRLSSDKYMVETIVLDDLVDLLPRRDDGSPFKQAILKIDIEGYEPYAFQKADYLFDRLDIRIVYMEWGKLAEQRSDFELIEKMIEFFRKRNYEAISNDFKLDLSNWKNWPWDIVWSKK